MPRCPACSPERNVAARDHPSSLGLQKESPAWRARGWRLGRIIAEEADPGEVSGRGTRCALDDARMPEPRRPRCSARNKARKFCPRIYRQQAPHPAAQKSPPAGGLEGRDAGRGPEGARGTRRQVRSAGKSAIWETGSISLLSLVGIAGVRICNAFDHRGWWLRSLFRREHFNRRCRRRLRRRRDSRSRCRSRR
jgi:hypothetical protein